MDYSLTIFNSIFDNKTHRKMTFSTWEKFEELLYMLSEQPGYKPKKGERKPGSALITPAIYEKGTTRANANVISWAGWVALDVDEYEGSLDDAIEIFKQHRFVCYSSASSTKEKPKFRVILPLTRHVESNKIKHLWYALNKEFNSLGDPQTKDLSRMYYVPAQYPNSYQFIFTNNGSILNPDDLMAKHKYVIDGQKNLASQLPLEIQKQLNEHIKSKLTNTKFVWTNWRTCPFVNKSLVNEYFSIGESGWYHKMYQIMMSISANAIRKGYPITPEEIEGLVREIDMETGGWYKGRPVRLEATRAIEYALRTVKV